ncbi:hypothetical protein [Dendronalium sp. ChiSLP03b]|uniref:hypothetical protein n=1 Tax=Dendronalium sp. ChiSLP03b TaxID=3075381 RepID=UPI002AD59BC5|nr:hypothetical protein [Dendronalium sp. ChiSLP03b]MDZ8203649.1 hypothetical protein [Dendronalium sp. ChiSLP03b]
MEGRKDAGTRGQGRKGETALRREVPCAGFQGTPLGGFADLKEVPSRCGNFGEGFQRQSLMRQTPK